MSLFKNNKVIAGIVVVVLLVLCYWAFFSGGSNTAALSSSSVATTSPASQELLVALTNLQTIQLNGGIFSDPVFQSLTDFDVTIPPQTAGRSDPFSPFSATALAPAGNSAVVLPASH